MPGRGALPPDNGAEHLVPGFLFPVMAADHRPQDLLRDADVALRPVLHFDDLRHHGNRDFLRRLGTDGEADGRMHTVQHLAADTLLPQALLHELHPAPGTHKPDIGMFFSGDGPQAVPVILMSPGHNHEIAVAVPCQPGQRCLKFLADYLIRTGRPSMIRKERTIIDAGDMERQQLCDFNDGDGHMSGSADDELFLMAQAFDIKRFSCQRENAAATIQRVKRKLGLRVPVGYVPIGPLTSGPNDFLPEMLR